MSRAIYWFRNDLRIDDNEGLLKAAADFKEVLPVYVIDERWLKGSQFHIERIGPFRMKFLLESLQDLQSQLQKIGSNLRVEVGHPVEVLTNLKKRFNCTQLFAQKATAFEECKDEYALSQRMEVEFLWGETLYHPDDLPFPVKDLPESFTAFRKKVEKEVFVREALEAPLYLNTPEDFGSKIPDAESLGMEAIEADERAALHFKGGLTKGQERLHYYLWDSELITNYKQTRNGLIGADYSSKFSPWLANGSLSPRQIYWQIRKFEKYVKKNSSTYWLIFELLWRDYFHFVALKHGHKIYRRSGITGKEKISWGSDRHFALWRDGKTGEPFIDANMHEMNATGFMSNRGRQNVASYLMHTMKIDWRLGAAYFEKMLIDYDPCSNYGNWIYIAGVGNDPRGGREFDTPRQKATYDPRGEYQRLWD